jgi:hypothetical protein
MEGYMQVLLNFDSQLEDDMQLAMIGMYRVYLLALIYIRKKQPLWLNVKVVAFEKFAFHSCGFES